MKPEYIFEFSRKCNLTQLAERENCTTGGNSPEETQKNLKNFNKQFYHYFLETDSASSSAIYQNYHLDFSLLNQSQVSQLNPFTWERSYLPYTLPVSFPFYGEPVQTIQIWSGGFVTLNRRDKETLSYHYITICTILIEQSQTQTESLRVTPAMN